MTSGSLRSCSSTQSASSLCLQRQRSLQRPPGPPSETGRGTVSSGLPTSGLSCVPSAAPTQALLPWQGAPGPLAPVPTVPSLQATLCRTGRRHPDPKADTPGADRLGDHGGRAFTGLSPHRYVCSGWSPADGTVIALPADKEGRGGGAGKTRAPRSCFLPGTGECCPRAPTHSESPGRGPLPRCFSSVTTGARGRAGAR